ncbi:MAG: aminoglycoside adenylyltransferase domain-containing protein [Tissierellales bacterium]
MNQSIEIMTNRIVNILQDNKPSILLFGSVVLKDFKLGWSDIDILCLTKSEITDVQADLLLNLRQVLLSEYDNNSYFRLFEGGFLSLDQFINRNPDTVIYWGTSSQRITGKYHLDPFSMIELMEKGYLLYGEEVRDKFSYPTKEKIIKAVVNHYEAIRKYAVTTDRSLYSAGWLLDIARCIYTLRTGRIIAKTKAGKWALDNNLVPDVDIMKKVINIREEPNKYKDDNEIMEWLETLGKYIQKFADVLENEILIAKL